MRKNELDLNSTADKNHSAEGNKKDDQSTKPIHNPFEEGTEEITSEELKQEELFKEAQTERD